MATTTSLPPQAYTRDTLVKAIEWLSTQPASVRERANSADLVVSYYLQARRRTAVQMEAPVSGEAFKSDLKHLAQDLKQFEEALGAPPPPPRPPTATLFEQLKLTPAAAALPTPMQDEPVRTPARLEQAAGPKVFAWEVDDRSLASAREIQRRLNLGHESEALRFLLMLGAERARELFP